MVLCSCNFIVGQTHFLCPVLKKIQDLYSDSAIWWLLLSWSVPTGSAPLLYCFSPLASYTNWWRFCGGFSSKGLMVCFPVQPFVIHHSLQQKWRDICVGSAFCTFWSRIWRRCQFILTDSNDQENPNCCRWKCRSTSG